MNVRILAALLVLVVHAGGAAQSLRVSRDGRYFQENGRPFFWLGDTAWLLLKKCTREETIAYLDTRRRQGFNVVQIMVLHDLKNATNAYGAGALIDQDVSKPRITPGDDFRKPEEYDYWDHVDWVVDQAAKRGMFAALVPVWGSNVNTGHVSESQALSYAKFLAERFRSKPNIIWLNGGDLKGDLHPEVWNAIGETLRANDPNHLIGYHPRGRFSSSDWFHAKNWLDFNMFQSGHRTYEQDNSPEDKHHFGEDNWRYVAMDRALSPAKPTLDGEPSYENIPHGLHDPKLPRWNDSDVRRYAYWSVFDGAAGFTYGENSVMQFFKTGDSNPAYGATFDWRDSITSPGARRLKFLKNLMLSVPYSDRVPASEIVANQGERYDHIAATRGANYAFLYTYTGRTIEVKLGFIPGRSVHAAWFDPRTGQSIKIGTVANSGITSFDPPGDEKNGNDWVLLLTR